VPLRLGAPMPSLEGAVEWWHTDGSAPVLGLDKVTLVHFWAVSCHICHETMAEVIAIRERYLPQGLQVVALHMPRSPEDTDLRLVRDDVQAYGITQPVGLDHLHKVAERFQNEYVPAFFVFGRDGTLVFRAAGDKGFQKVEPKIRTALSMPEDA